jgi:hypothetical protein
MVTPIAKKRLKRNTAAHPAACGGHPLPSIQGEGEAGDRAPMTFLPRWG